MPTVEDLQLRQRRAKLMLRQKAAQSDQQPMMPGPGETMGLRNGRLAVMSQDEFAEREAEVRPAIASMAAGNAAVALAGKALGAAPAVAQIAGRVAASGGAAGGVDYVEKGDLASAGKAAVFGMLGQGGGEAVSAALPAMVRGIIRGGETGRRSMQEAITDLAGADAVPTLGQASELPQAKILENLVGKVPGATSRLKRAVTQQADKVQGMLTRTAEGLAGRNIGRIDPMAAGVEVQRGIKNFTVQFQGKSDELFGKLRKLLPGDRRVAVGNTAQALDELTALIPGAEATSAAFVNPKVKAIAEALQTDVGATGQLPVEALFKLRSTVGRALGDAGLVSDLPRAELKRLYAALSSDIEAAAKAGGEQTHQAFKRANAYYRAGNQRIETALEPLAAKAVPEKVFQALETGGKLGATQLRTLRRSLSKDQWEIVAATAVKNLGKATPGAQDAAGEVFSFETYLTRWNQLDNAAKDALFGGVGTIKTDLEKIARHAQRVRESSRALFGTSGTAENLAGMAAVSGAAGALVTGNFGTLALIAAPMVGANGLARLMTNPSTIKWLAESTKIRPNGISAHLGRLAAIAARSDDETREAISGYLGALGEALPEETPEPGPSKQSSFAPTFARPKPAIPPGAGQ